MSYLNPIRMYIFISAVFFLVTFSEKKEENKPDTATITKQDVNVFRQHLADSLRGKIVKGKKLSKIDSLANTLYGPLITRLDTPLNAKISKEESLGADINDRGEVVFRIRENKYADSKDYEARQLKLPDTARDGFLHRYVIEKAMRLKNERHPVGQLTVTRNIEHDLEKIMFLLLPVFALIVRFFYSRKKYLYSQHIIFSLHFHSFVFFAFLVLSLISFTDPSLGVGISLYGIVYLCIFVYLVAALYKTYQEALWLSITKALSIALLYIIALIISLWALIAISFVLI